MSWAKRISPWTLACTALLGGCLLLAQEPSPPGPTTAKPSSEPTTHALSTTQPLPTAQEVIDRYIQVTGGRDAYASIVSRHIQADYVMADLGVTGKLEAYMRNDGSARQTISIPNLDTFIEGVTGDLVWSMSQTNGPRILNGLEAQSLRQTLSFAPEASLEPYRSAVVTEIVELNGVPCYKMVLTPKAIETTETRYYDAKTGYLSRRDTSVMTAEGPIAVITRYGEYEDAPPIRIPMKVRQSMSGLSPEQIVTKVEHNIAMPDELFAAPDEVKELLKRRATTRNSN